MPTCIGVKKMSEVAAQTERGQHMHQEWMVQFADATASAAMALTATFGASSIPVYGTTVGVLTVTNISSVRSKENPTIFHVTVDWTVVAGMVLTKPAGTGVKWRTTVAVDSIVYEEPVNMDANGVPLQLPTGEPIDPPMNKEYYDERFRFTFHTDQVDYTNINLCRGCLNSDVVTITIKGQARTFAAKTLKLIDVNYGVVYEADGTAAWEVTYIIAYRADTWIRKVQPKSFYHLASGALVPNMDNGKVLDTAKFLTADGTDWVRAGGSLPPPLAFQIETAVAFSGTGKLIAGITTIP